MTMTDPIADFLTRLRNANTAYHDQVKLPHSKIKANIAGAQMTHSGRYVVKNGSTLEYIPNDAATPNLIAGIGSPQANAQPQSALRLLQG